MRIKLDDLLPVREQTARKPKRKAQKRSDEPDREAQRKAEQIANEEDFETKLRLVQAEAVRKAEQTALRAVTRLKEIDDRLTELRDTIKRIQPKRHGAVILELKPCGKHCMGCPHARWKQWLDPSRVGVKPGDRNERHKEGWRGYVIERPLKRLYKTGVFEEIYPQLRELVREAENLLRERQRLVGYLSNLSRMLKQSDR